MSAQDWFVTREMEPGLYMLSEPPHVNSYLVVGRERAILFDTGMAFANIREVVDELTDLDVLVVNSHYHFDHIGGNHLFEERAIHEAGATPITEPVPAEWLTAYLEFTETMLAKFDVYRELDDGYFHLLTPELLAKPLPAEFDPASWEVVPTVPTRTLSDGDVLDLGGKALRVIHLPGHTPDCICLLDEASGALLAGDVLTTGPFYAHLPDSDVHAFRHSTRRLADEVQPQVRAIYPAHILRNAVDAGFLSEVADGFDEVVGGAAEASIGFDIFGDTVTEYRFDRFSIVVPSDWKPDGSG